MTRMTGQDYAVVGNLINTYIQNRHRYAKAYLLEQGLEGNILVWQYSCNITAGLALVVEKSRLQVFPLGSVFSYILNIRPVYNAVNRFA